MELGQTTIFCSFQSQSAFIRYKTKITKFSLIKFNLPDSRDSVAGTMLFRLNNDRGSSKPRFMLWKGRNEMVVYVVGQGELKKEKSQIFKENFKILIDETQSTLIGITDEGRLVRIDKNRLEIFVESSYHLSMDTFGKEKTQVASLSNRGTYMIVTSFRFDFEEKKYITTLHLVKIRSDGKFKEINKTQIKNFGRPMVTKSRYINRIDFGLETAEKRPVILMTFNEQPCFIYSYVVVKEKIRQFCKPKVIASGNFFI